MTAPNPFGTRAVLPLGADRATIFRLPELERQGGTAVAGFRDVIDDPAFVRQLWEDNGTYEALDRYYSAICVYGDPAMTDFVEEYALPPALASRLHYCGYLGRGIQPTTDVPLYERPLIIATSGGGVDGASVLEPFIEAAAQLRPSIGGTWMMVTGPLMDVSEHERLEALGVAAGVTVRRVVPALRSHVALADCLVAMGGYNTACDIISFRLPAVLVPRAGASREQELRATRLDEWGVVATVAPGIDCAARLSDAIAAKLDRRATLTCPVPTDGLTRALDVFDGATDQVRAT